MLRKLDTSSINIIDDSHESCCSCLSTFEKQGTLALFVFAMSLFTMIESVGILSYSLRLIDSTEMLFYDSISILIVSILLIVNVTDLSQQIRVVLYYLERINGKSNQAQIRRIFAIVVAADIFFVVRIMVELLLSVYLIMRMRGQLFLLLLYISLL